MKLGVSSCTLSSFFKFGLMLGSIGLLQACDRHEVKLEPDSQTEAEQEGGRISAANVPPEVVPVSAKSLTQVAGQATLRAETDLNPVVVPDYAKDFIGRYHTEIECDGSFAPCNEGRAEFILSLMPDGTVHRSILQYGKVFVDNTKTHTTHNVTYRKDRWTVNPERTELVVNRKEGASFYYKIKDSNHLVMNLEKIYSEKQKANQELFDSGFPAPTKAYELIKDTSFHIQE